MDREDALRRQFVREARIGVGMIAVALTVFLGVAYVKLSGAFNRLPEVVVSAQHDVASTANASAQNVHAAHVTATALQAATRSVVDQVVPRADDTSATKAPPMPIPKTLIPESQPIRQVAPIQSDRTGDSSTQMARVEKELVGQATSPSITESQPGDLQSTDSSEEGTPRDSSFYNQSIAAAKSRPPNEGGRPAPLQPDRAKDFGSILNRPLPDRAASSAPAAGMPVQFKSSADPDDLTTVKPSTERVVQWAIGDNLWTIAQQNYGDGRLVRALAAYNQIDESAIGQIPQGTQIRIPAIEQLNDDFPALIPADFVPHQQIEQVGANDLQSPENYVTIPGDTLFGIAREELGQASRFVEIIKLNSSRLPRDVSSSTKLPGGIRLRLPKK